MIKFCLKKYALNTLKVHPANPVMAVWIAQGYSGFSSCFHHMPAATEFTGRLCVTRTTVRCTRTSSISGNFSFSCESEQQPISASSLNARRLDECQSRTRSCQTHGVCPSTTRPGEPLSLASINNYVDCTHSTLACTRRLHGVVRRLSSPFSWTGTEVMVSCR